MPPAGWFTEVVLLTVLLAKHGTLALFANNRPNTMIVMPPLIISAEEVDEVLVYEDSIFVDFHMISVPLMMKLISDNKRFQFTGGLEMMLPFKLIADDTEKEVDLINHVNKVGLNMLFGIGYRIPINRNFLVINLNYSQGLTNIANNLDDPDSLFPRIRFTSFKLTAAWLFAVGKAKSSEN